MKKKCLYICSRCKAKNETVIHRKIDGIVAEQPSCVCSECVKEHNKFFAPRFQIREEK